MLAAFMIMIVAALILWLQGYVYRKLWTRKLDFQLEFSKKAVFESESATLIETVTNRKLLPLPWLGVKFEVSRNLRFLDSTNSAVSDYYYRNDLFTVLMYQKITRRLDFCCEKRGYYAIRSADLISNNMLFSQKLSFRTNIRDTITVFPRLIDASELEPVARQIQGDIVTKSFMNPDPFRFKGIREYMPSDPFRDVNFAASAKTGALMVNIKERTVTEDVVILLNLEDYNIWSSPDVFEEAIRLAASLSTYYIDNGIPVSLVTNGRDVVTKQALRLSGGSSGTHLNNIYDLLARIDMEQERSHMSSLVYDSIEKSGGNKVFLLISTYHEGDLYDAFMYIRGLNCPALWIIPAFAEMEVKLPEADYLHRWEVKMGADILL